MNRVQKQIRLLIVDDDADDRQMFIDAIREIDANIIVDVAIDGYDAIRLLGQHEYKPDLIFLDLRMPRYNGRRCLFELKKDDRFKNIPVIIYTTSREEEEAIKLLGEGAVHFISKPSDPSDIYYVVSAALEEQLLEQRNSNSFN